MDGTLRGKIVPEKAAGSVPPDNPACPRNGRDRFRGLPRHGAIMAVHIRGLSVIPGIMRGFRAWSTARIVTNHLTARV